LAFGSDQDAAFVAAEAFLVGQAAFQAYPAVLVAYRAYQPVERENHSAFEGIPAVVAEVSLAALAAFLAEVGSHSAFVEMLKAAGMTSQVVQASQVDLVAYRAYLVVEVSPGSFEGIPVVVAEEAVRDVLAAFEGIPVVAGKTVLEVLVAFLAYLPVEAVSHWAFEGNLVVAAEAFLVVLAFLAEAGSHLAFD
jgi:phosphatidylserine synthase